ncbi:hypothetical protein KIPB_016264, partial [Kipferlia bialata]|eukprot:g16264.t1
MQDPRRNDPPVPRDQDEDGERDHQFQALLAPDPILEVSDPRNSEAFSAMAAGIREITRGHHSDHRTPTIIK